MSYRALVAASLVLAATSYPSVAQAEPTPSPPPAAAATDDDIDVPSAASATSPAPPPASPTAPGAVPSSSPASSSSSSAPVTPAPGGGPSTVAGASTKSTEAAPAPPREAPDKASAQEQEIAQLRARLDALEAGSSHEPAHAVVRSDPPALPTTSFDASPWSRTWSRGFLVSGYVQGQYQQSQLSENQLDANGNPLNQNRFLVRRARLRFERGWDWAFATIEVDGNNVNGLAFGLRRAHASLLWRAPDPLDPPRLVFSVGLTDTPFGYELYEPNRTRLFLERTTASRAFFPGDGDFGAQLTGAIGAFRYAVAVMDGTPVPDNDPTAAGFDPTSQKDLLARFGAETRPDRDLGLSGGASFDRGTGFHPGATATQDSLQWRDLNNNGTIDAAETSGVPGQAAQPSKTFSRWLLGFDAQLRLDTPVGRGLLYAEAYVGSNNDRGLFLPDPTTTGINLREVGWYVAFVQEVSRYGLLGFRVDAYNPNADSTRSVAGNLLPVDQTITTFSPLVGLVLPGRGRLMFEYDRIVDHEGLDARGVPTDLRNDQWALRLQVEM
jgi:hypothetical protein